MVDVVTRGKFLGKRSHVFVAGCVVLSALVAGDIVGGGRPSYSVKVGEEERAFYPSDVTRTFKVGRYPALLIKYSDACYFGYLRARSRRTGSWGWYPGIPREWNSDGTDFQLQKVKSYPIVVRKRFKYKI